MQRLLLTLDTPAENLALDEALLDAAEDSGPAWEWGTVEIAAADGGRGPLVAR